MTLTSVEQIRALAHPLRQRILRSLTITPSTNKQLASSIGEPPGRLHFHLRELEKAGLVELVEERPKGGVIEKYYRATARNLRLGDLLGARGAGEQDLPLAALEAARQELERTVAYHNGGLPSTKVGHDQASLSPEQLARISGHLDAIVEEMRQAAETPAEDAASEPFLLTFLLHPVVTDRGESRPEGGDAGDGPDPH